MRDERVREDDQVGEIVKRRFGLQRVITSEEHEETVSHRLGHAALLGPEAL
jgi:hypothetical protein